MSETDVAALRDALADRLPRGLGVDHGAVVQAFRQVPRHLFLPQVDPAQAYADEAIPVKWAADGRAVSSSSQPAIMAIMLAQLSLKPGMRVLEIGTGTGYNAALLAHLVGEAGAVVTVDIDSELADAARQRLNAAGYPSVTVAAGDGAAGWPAGAPYDRVIVTASARDLSPSWTAQLSDGGRLVLPLSLRGIAQSVALTRADVGEHLASISVVPCAFMPLAGELAGQDPVRPFGEVPGGFLHVEDERDLDLDLAALFAALSQPGQVVATGVTISRSYLFSGLGLWLALHEPGVGELIALGEAALGAAVERGLLPAAIGQAVSRASTTVLVGETSLAVIGLPPAPSPPGAGRPGAEPGAGPSQADPSGADRPAAEQPAAEQDVGFEAHVRGYGPDGDRLAERLAACIRAWETAGRPNATTLRVRAYPRTAADSGHAAFTIAMPHTHFLLDW